MPSTSCLQSQQINNFAYPTGIQKQRLPQKQYIYLYNFPAESADSIIKVVIDEGRDCGPSKAHTVVLGGPNINKESKPLPYNTFESVIDLVSFTEIPQLLLHFLCK